MNPQALIRSFLPALVFGVTWLSSGQTIPAWFPKISPLPPRSGEIIRVGTADELLAAVQRLSPGGTILLADRGFSAAILSNECRMPRRISHPDRVRDSDIRREIPPPPMLRFAPSAPSTVGPVKWLFQRYRPSERLRA
jgi:hypothetical protein